MKILLVRHGETDNNVIGMSSVVGNNAPINKNGIVQADTAAKIADKFNPTKVYSSPFMRCIQTAESISQTTGA